MNGAVGEVYSPTQFSGLPSLSAQFKEDTDTAFLSAHAELARRQAAQWCAARSAIRPLLELWEERAIYIN